MPYFIVYVEEEHKILISSRVVKESSFPSNNQSPTFNDLYEYLVQPELYLHEVHVFVGKGDSKWNFVQDGLQDELNLFTTLKLDQFKIKLNYNHFYFEGKHKKHQLACNTLIDLTSSLNLSLSTLWACEVIWESVIEQVLSLIKMTWNIIYQKTHLRTINYIWKVPTYPDDRDKTKLAQIMTSVQNLLPKYYTKQMRKNVLHKVSINCNITNSLIIQVFTFQNPNIVFIGDATITNDVISKEIEERLKMILMLEDPSIIVDMRINNGFKGTKFDCFWSELDAYFNEINAAIDDHYYHDYVYFICADDKHKVPIRKGVTTSTGVRNKKSIVLQDADLIMYDHNFTKLSLTPSVIFFCEVPKSIKELFYSRKVFVSFKDTTFQSSNGIRHATEFFKVIFLHYQPSVPPIFCLYTNRGPDHQITYRSVQIFLICLFLKKDFNMLIALRIAPHQSWNNPAKRIILILNLALQGVALVHKTMLEDMEILFSKANTLKEICRAAKKSSQLTGELQKYITTIQEFLRKRTEQLVLHDEPFSCYDLAGESEISLFFEIKKCNDVICTICKAIRLPQHIFVILDFLSDPTPSAGTDIFILFYNLNNFIH
ncbi:hypothetical protein GLOIN_2v1791831 [Rhizophagus clarus]|uniref:Uncharacterized protein n=1 Tax=Rhizophagus clarus TaxID=94130 RepID=A0A8H3QGP3_9GLOM|nr:hypothetical protein GLOIN_2v1791831 [Rhizophagus clarus]